MYYESIYERLKTIFDVDTFPVIKVGDIEYNVYCGNIIADCSFPNEYTINWGLYPNNINVSTKDTLIIAIRELENWLYNTFPNISNLRLTVEFEEYRADIDITLKVYE